ncbi:hypothetical protein ACIQVL_48635 [Streptomyces sp. NPDC090499]|uniref:hypothetical protein n=1 Tax=Streptomyces sp. NPDC090499 TaxID=3365965 RepID=UPI00380F5A69
MATNQRTAKKTTPAQRDAAKKTTPARRAPAKKPATRRPAAKKTAAAPLPQRDKPFMTDIQAHATIASRLAGITTERIRDWHDHRNGTATRPLHDGSHLHYVLATRTLTWQAICPMGATHTYTLDRPSTAMAARLHTDRCTETHAQFNHLPRLTDTEWAELGIQVTTTTSIKTTTTPSWARPLPDEPDTVSTTVLELPATPRVLADRLSQTPRTTAADTQPMSAHDIAASLAARAAHNETAKEHPQP